MREHEITTRQTGIILFFIMLSTKLLYLPSLFYREAKTNALLAMALALVIDFILLLFVLRFCARNPGINLFQFIKKRSFEWIAKIAYILVLFFLFIKLLIVINASYVYVRDSFFSQATLYIFLFVVLFLTNHATLCPTRALARTSEFFYPVAISGIVITLYLGISSSMFNLPNINWHGDFSGVFLSIFKYISYFGDPIFLLLINDKIKYDKKYKKNIIKYSIIAIISCFILYFVYFGMFSYVVPSHTNAAQDITQFTDYSDDVGRLDIIGSIIYLIISLLQLSIYFRLCVSCVHSIVASGHQKLELIVFNIILIINLYFIFTSNNKIINFSTIFMNYYTLIFIYLFSIILSFFKLNNKKYYPKINKGEK